MASSAVISIVAHIDRGLRLIPGLTNTLVEVPDPAGGGLRSHEFGVGHRPVARELPDLHTDVSEMLVTLGQLTTDRPMDDMTLFVSYE